MSIDWEHPNWNNLSKTHDWKNYVSDKVIEIWDTFNNEQKQVLSENYNEMANKEEWD